MKSSRGLSVPEVIILIAVILIVLALFFTRGGGHIEAARKVQARNDVTQIATAIVAFQTEYGRPPGTNVHIVGGDLLAALMGGNEKLNPRRLVFLEVDPARNRKSGLTNGVFVDPWGAPYRIALTRDGSYGVLAGSNGMRVNKSVAVWTEPAMGRDAASLSPAKLARRYVTSWD